MSCASAAPCGVGELGPVVYGIALELRYHVKSREVQRSLGYDKREFIVALVGEVQAVTDSNDF